MNPLQILRVAGRALLRNKMRSVLTTLGIIIGVFAVNVTVAIGEGAKKQVEAAFASMGTNLLIVMSGSSAMGGVQGGFGSQPTLTWDDLRAIRGELPSVRYASPMLRASAQVLSDDQNWGTQINGVAAEYLEIRNWPMAHGTRFTQGDIETGTKVALLGGTVADKLYGAAADPTGLTVRIKNIPFTVGGVLAKKGQSPMGQDYDDVVLIPYSTFTQKIQGGLKNFLSGSIMVSADGNAGTARALKDVTALLRDRHNIRVGAEDDFSIRNLAEIAQAQQQGTATVSLFLSIVAAVSLIVGGIGIMNIMLVSVTERTREIGLRMAVGARPRDVLFQFIVEAVVLSVAGGLIGIGMGVGLTNGVAASLGWSAIIRPDVIAISVIFSALVGIIFGLYPAWKASRLDPIEALRYE